MFALGRDVGIDLGTATVLIHLRGKGIVLREPSVVALERGSRKILAVGTEARRMLGRTPGNIIATRPLRDGVIADYEITRAMLQHFLDRVSGPRLLSRPRVMICIPAVVTTVEKRAVLEAAMEVGARRASLIEEPLAAALGAGLDVTKPSGHMVVDIGGGTTDVAVLSLGGVVRSESIRVAGDKFDEAIVRYVKREHNLLIGERSAEEIKIRIATASGSRNEEMEVRGRDLMTGLPKTVRITSAETRLALEESVAAIMQTIRTVLEQTPPELTADIQERGIILTGGGALLHGLDERIRAETGISATVADDPTSCVARGTGIALEQYNTLEDHLVVLRRVL